MSRTVLLVALLVTLVSCGGTSLESPAQTESESVQTEGLGLVVEAPDGSKRIPYVGGAFVTRAREMPIEVEQAVLGLPTDRPVVVWAGLDRSVTSVRDR